MSDIFDKIKQKRLNVAPAPTQEINPGKKAAVPEGLFIACEGCQKALYHRTLADNLYVCPHCNFHFRISVKDRLAMIVDELSFKEKFSNLTSLNPLSMPEYETKLATSSKVSHYPEAFVCGTASLDGMKVALGILDSFFMMGSMGSVVGEKITRLIEYSIKESLPLVIFSASGGARMQEGIFSLMQMAKTASALKRHHEAGLLFISVFTHPTTGGVTASFASLGDIHVAEHGALIGFAGARVIKQTIQQDLPDGFQTAAFQLQHGQVDLVVHRKHLRKTLCDLLAFHTARAVEETV